MKEIPNKVELIEQILVVNSAIKNLLRESLMEYIESLVKAGDREGYIELEAPKDFHNRQEFVDLLEEFKNKGIGVTYQGSCSKIYETGQLMDISVKF